MGKAKIPLPKGFRFSPTDVELLCYYLKRKAKNRPFKDPTRRFKEINLYNYSPDQLREVYGVQKEKEMYIFTRKVPKYKGGKGTQLQRRTITNGCWKVSYTKKDIEFDGRLVGHRASLVYCTGEGRGMKTDWLMWEYSLPNNMMLDEWLLCKVYPKEDEEVKTKTDLVLKPQASLRDPEYSSSFSASRATAGQSTAMISSKRDNQRIDRDRNAPLYFGSIARDLLFEEAESDSSAAMICSDSDNQSLDSERTIFDRTIPSYFRSTTRNLLCQEVLSDSSTATISSNSDIQRLDFKRPVSNKIVLHYSGSITRDLLLQRRLNLFLHWP